ncbi:hypothetical protein DN051_25460 [Streptomyces cadmiisoli]|uniref:Uncharacterized protein n=1 Tax=Streptomyces cadmiisoli TaxID=2184053 RepID=A0A2Z4J3W4_9ACTN|nr:hypothetical protein DN051_25460 [Streptomyces cadmiisoli]
MPAAARADPAGLRAPAEGLLCDLEPCAVFLAVSRGSSSRSSSSRSSLRASSRSSSPRSSSSRSARGSFLPGLSGPACRPSVRSCRESARCSALALSREVAAALLAPVSSVPT